MSKELYHKTISILLKVMAMEQANKNIVGNSKNAFTRSFVVTLTFLLIFLVVGIVTIGVIIYNNSAYLNSVALNGNN